MMTSSEILPLDDEEPFGYKAAFIKYDCGCEIIFYDEDPTLLKTDLQTLCKKHHKELYKIGLKIDMTEEEE